MSMSILRCSVVTAGRNYDDVIASNASLENRRGRTSKNDGWHCNEVDGVFTVYEDTDIELVS